MCFFIIFNSLFNGRQVVKDTKVKARYHHLIANSFVEVSFSQKEGFVAFGSEGDSLETKVVKPFFFKLTSNVPHQSLFQEILKINAINTVLIQVQKSILPVYHVHWLHSTGCAVQYQGITLTVWQLQFLVSLLWRAFSEQKLKLLTMHSLKKKNWTFSSENYLFQVKRQEF